MEKEKNSFLITCVSCIIVLLLMCYFGINSSFTKATFASKTCPSGKYLIDDSYCCPNSNDIIKTEGSKTYCVNPPKDLVNPNPSISLISSTVTSSGVACLINIAKDPSEELTSEYCSGIFGQNWSTDVDLSQGEGGTVYVNCSSDCAVLAEDASLSTTTIYNIKYNIDIQDRTGFGDLTTTKRHDEPHVILGLDYFAWNLPANCKFKGWSTRNGYQQTVSYTVGSEYTTNADLELFAAYDCTYTVELDSRGGIIKTYNPAGGGPAENVNSEKYDGIEIIYDNIFNEVSITGSAVVEKTGFTFNGWSDSTACNNVKRLNEFKVSGLQSKKTLYACYTENSSIPSDEPSTPTQTTYNITYNIDLVDRQGYSDYPDTKIHGVDYVVKSASGVGFELPNHCEFKGWSTRNDYLQTINYLSGAKYNGNANLELYAYYMCEQSIKFDARGGTIVSYEPAFGTKVNINQATYTKKQYSETLFNKMVIGSSEDEFVVTKSGYTFRGWSEDASCNSVKQLGNIYIDGNATSKTLYACYNKTSNSGNTDNVDKNPQTGSIAIFIIWVIGIVAVVYSAWYFRKLRNN